MNERPNGKVSEQIFLVSRKCVQIWMKVMHAFHHFCFMMAVCFFFWCHNILSWLWLIMTFSLEHGICCIFPSELFCPFSDGYSVSKKLVFSLLLTQLAYSEGALIFDCMKIFFFPRDDLGRTVSFQGKHQPLYKHATRSDRSSW